MLNHMAVFLGLPKKRRSCNPQAQKQPAGNLGTEKVKVNIYKGPPVITGIISESKRFRLWVGG